jgi:ABC-2 type transport system ATP-binding protein
MSEIVLEIKNLTRRFGAFTAVDALTLSVNAGEVFGLLGSNGAGKTTTIKMLTTLLPPSSGGARVAGFSITNQAVNVRRAIGYVPQAVSVDGSLTGYENLLIFAKLYDLPRREQRGRIREALEFMGLTADGGRLVGQYSGGMGCSPHIGRAVAIANLTACKTINSRGTKTKSLLAHHALALMRNYTNTKPVWLRQWTEWPERHASII